MHEFLKTD